MSILPIQFDGRAIDVSFTSDSLHIVLADGREMLVPLEWVPKLRDANEKARGNWRLTGQGVGIHWPDIDEDVCVSTLIKGHDVF